ncbi:uncharacterized protein [Chlorocebus sabaeus]|uniref:uncharacterized protein n=1 Tax=Chlorocebus sabaeus TaxID=60711 RepID=UPI003BF9D189
MRRRKSLQETLVSLDSAVCRTGARVGVPVGEGAGRLCSCLRWDSRPKLILFSSPFLRSNFLFLSSHHFLLSATSRLLLPFHFLSRKPWYSTQSKLPQQKGGLGQNWSKNLKWQYLQIGSVQQGFSCLLPLLSLPSHRGALAYSGDPLVHTVSPACLNLSLLGCGLGRSWASPSTHLPKSEWLLALVDLSAFASLDLQSGTEDSGRET